MGLSLRGTSMGFSLWELVWGSVAPLMHRAAQAGGGGGGGGGVQPGTGGRGGGGVQPGTGGGGGGGGVQPGTGGGGGVNPMNMQLLQQMLQGAAQQYSQTLGTSNGGGGGGGGGGVPRPQQQQGPALQYQSQMEQLQAMGFTDRFANLQGT